MVVLIILCLGVYNFCDVASYVYFHIFSKVKETEWPPIGKIAVHLAYDMFSWCKYLIF